MPSLNFPSAHSLARAGRALQTRALGAVAQVAIDSGVRGAANRARHAVAQAGVHVRQTIEQCAARIGAGTPWMSAREVGLRAQERANAGSDFLLDDDDSDESQDLDLASPAQAALGRAREGLDDLGEQAVQALHNWKQAQPGADHPESQALASHRAPALKITPRRRKPAQIRPLPKPLQPARQQVSAAGSLGSAPVNWSGALRQATESAPLEAIPMSVSLAPAQMQQDRREAVEVQRGRVDDTLGETRMSWPRKPDDAPAAAPDAPPQG